MNKKKVLVTLSVLVIATFGTAFYMLTQITVPLTGIIVDNNGKAYANKEVKIGEETVHTDHLGQYLTRVKVNRTYKVEDKDVYYSVKVERKNPFNRDTRKDKIVVMGRGEVGATIKNGDDTLTMEVRPGTVFLDINSDYKITDNGVVTLDTPLELKTGDTFVIAPTMTFAGYVGKIEKQLPNDGKTMYQTSIIKVGDALDRLKIDTGMQELSDDMTVINSADESDYKVVPTGWFDGKISPDVSLEMEDKAKIDPIEIKGDNLKIEDTPKVAGTLNIKANIDFKNFKNTDVAVNMKGEFKNTIEFYMGINEKPTLDKEAIILKGKDLEGFINRAKKSKPKSLNLFRLPILTPVTQLVGVIDTSVEMKAYLQNEVSYKIDYDMVWSGKDGFNSNQNNEPPGEIIAEIELGGQIKGKISIKVGPAVAFANQDLFRVYYENLADLTAFGNAKWSAFEPDDLDIDGDITASWKMGIYGDIPAISTYLPDSKIASSTKWTLWEKEVWNYSVKGAISEDEKSSKNEQFVTAYKVNTEDAIKANKELAEWLLKSSYGKGKTAGLDGFDVVSSTEFASDQGQWFVNKDTADGSMYYYSHAGNFRPEMKAYGAMLDDYQPGINPYESNEMHIYSGGEPAQFSMLGTGSLHNLDGATNLDTGIAVYALKDGTARVIDNEPKYVWERVGIEGVSPDGNNYELYIRGYDQGYHYYLENDIDFEKGVVLYYPATNGYVYELPVSKPAEGTATSWRGFDGTLKRAPKGIQSAYQKILRKYSKETGKSKDAEVPKKSSQKTETIGMDIDAIKNGDFSSIQGTWDSKATNGLRYVVSGNTITEYYKGADDGGTSGESYTFGKPFQFFDTTIIFGSNAQVTNGVLSFTANDHSIIFAKKGSNIGRMVAAEEYITPEDAIFSVQGNPMPEQIAFRISE